jgi:hypothetical protein
VDFLHVHAKNPDYWGCFGSLQGIKIHIREFLYYIYAEAQQTARVLRIGPFSGYGKNVTQAARNQATVGKSMFT